VTITVMVHGAYTAQRALQAGVLDEIQIDQIPVLLGAGRRLFDTLPPGPNWKSCR
jgi:dihydrofolate reductase